MASSRRISPNGRNNEDLIFVRRSASSRVDILPGERNVMYPLRYSATHIITEKKGPVQYIQHGTTWKP